MKRIGLVVIALLVSSLPACAGDAAVKQSIAYVQKLQTRSNGFLAGFPKDIAPPAVPTLRATSSAIRALHYLNGEIPYKDACITFVETCHDPESGGFADRPKGKPDVFTTAVGLMAVTELNMPTQKYAKGAIKYMSDNAKSFEDIRIAAAGLERLKEKSPKNDDWLAEVKKLQNADGTFGKGAGQARATGGSVVTLLRLGGTVENADLIIKTLKAGQRQNGGYGKDDDEIASDLETTYRVMRCFVMLKAKPGNVEGIRSFVAKCRNADGGYAVAPGQPSSIGGTYFASIILHWLDQKQ